MIWVKILVELYTYLILIYATTFIILNICLGIFSLTETLTYLRINKSTDYNLLAASPHSPSLSIIAPAFNEAATIVANVRSLLSIYYNNLEIIVVNDGSSDDSLQKLIDIYELKEVHHFINQLIPTKTVKGVYKSFNPIYNKLIIVDKENGGKADALNAGINISSNDYIISIDVDCILAEDALLKIVKPIMDDPSGKIIASGGVVRIANSCIVEDGKLVKVNLPDNYLVRVQVLEYMRAFLLGRMAWSRLNGLLLISGAFGAFDKQLVIKCGGYNVNTVGEDMELVVRMRRYMQERNLPYRVNYIPDPLCWTEAPSTYNFLFKQRNRWMRGALQTLNIHRILFFNPRYGIMGMVSYPYWIFFEVLGVLVEFIGVVIFVIGGILGLVKWKAFLTMICFLFSIGICYSTVGIFVEVMSYNQYKKKGDILKLFLIAFLEPFFFHPFVVYANIMGIIDFANNKNGWGTSIRKGFDSKPSLSELKIKAHAK